MVRFIPAEELKADYGIFGHFYTVEVGHNQVVECRSVLEIASRSVVSAGIAEISGRRPDAVFVMMNPGSSRPLVDVNQRIRAGEIHNLAVSLVPTRPDTTQYQVMRLMHYCGWQHVRVLNLSDLRCTRSVEFFKQYQRLEESCGYDAHSVFSARRRTELHTKLTMHTSVPVVRAWGLSAELDPLIERCAAGLDPEGPLRGLMKTGSGNKFLHPLPSLQRQKLLWVDQMVEQCLGNNS